MLPLNGLAYSTSGAIAIPSCTVCGQRVRRVRTVRSTREPSLDGSAFCTCSDDRRVGI